MIRTIPDTRTHKKKNILAARFIASAEQWWPPLQQSHDTTAPYCKLNESLGPKSHTCLMVTKSLPPCDPWVTYTLGYV